MLKSYFDKLLHKTQYLHVLYLFGKKLSTCIFSFNNFSSCTPLKSLTTHSSHWLYSWIIVQTHIRLLLIPIKIYVHVHCQSYIHTADFPSPLSCRVVLVRHSSITGVHFGWCLHTVQNINKLGPCLLFLSHHIIGHSSWGRRCILGNRRQLNDIEILGSWEINS